MSGQTTSGTVLATPFRVGQVIEHAMRRAGRIPEQASQEDLWLARECLFTQFCEWANAGYPLWTLEYQLFGPTIGSPDVVLPYGTIDSRHVYWRLLNPYRGSAAAGSADVSVLFGGAPNADVTIAGPNPTVTIPIGGSLGATTTEVDTVGVLLGGSSAVTMAVEVQTSTDGNTWTTVQTLPSATYQPGAWTYFDLDPSITTAWIALVFPVTGSIALNLLQLGLANGVDVEIGALNEDDYYNLPDKQYQGGQPNSYWLFRNRDQPVVKIWPVPDQGYFYNGLVAVLMRRYIQDPGQLTNGLEVPARWYEGATWRLAATLLYELPDENPATQVSYFTLMAKQQRIQAVEAKAAKAEALMWSEERIRAPIRFTPNIAPYTR